jgi:hypothetical protein
MVSNTKIDNRIRIQQLYRRWNIVIDKNMEFKKFHNRILAAINTTLGEYILQNRDISRKFAFAIGYQQEPKTTAEELRDEIGGSLKDDNVYRIIAKTPNLQFLVANIQVLLLVLEKNHCPLMNDFANAINEAIEYSAGINLRIVKKDNRVTLYPSGAKLLDEAVVNDTLLWLNDYPNVAKTFEEALNIYLRKDVAKYRNLLDNLRFALEQILKLTLKNKKAIGETKGFSVTLVEGTWCASGNYQYVW